MDRRTLLAIVIVGVIIILTPYYLKMIAPERPDQAAPASKGVSPVPETSQEAVAGSGAQNTADPVVKQRDTRSEAERPWYAPDPVSEGRTVAVETPLYAAEFSTRGATVHSWIIKPSQPYLSEPEQMVDKHYADRNLTLIARGGRGLLRTGEQNFVASDSLVTLTEGGAPKSVSFTLDLPGDAFYRETYTFYPDRYRVDLNIESRGLDDLTGAATATFGWGGGLARTEADTAQDNFYTEAAFLMGGDKERMKSNGKKTNEEEATGPTAWVAQRTKYFLLALVPKSPAQGARLSTWPDSSYVGKYPPKLFETTLEFNILGDDFNRQITLYAGPLEQGHLEAVDPSLEQMMSWGWTIIKPFSKLVFWALVNLHKGIPNYGVVLILFSILVKVIVWPLTAKSYKSMKKMQKIQPLLKSVQEKYKDNPQKMQQEVMALYKEHGVNPMGGCWPTLLQMPLLYGLFIVFRSTIELRGQPFVLWINDLSMPDVLVQLPFSIPLYGSHIALLPIVMAVSTYLQSRQTATDPNQKMMTAMMPIMFLFLFNNFPSGLTLYYTLFNLLSFAQQKMLKVSDPTLDKELEEVEKEKERKEKRETKRAQKRGN